MPSRKGQRYDPDKLAPCGTPAAARRHYRHGEPPCGACLAANQNEKARQMGHQGGGQSIDRRDIRNGIPEFRPYVYRGTGRDDLTWWMT
jgi:hypothetical protein